MSSVTEAKNGTQAQPAKPTSRVFDAQAKHVDPRRYREFTVCVGRETILSESGIDTTVHDIIAKREKALVEGWKANQAGPYEERVHWSTFTTNWGDEVVWEGADLVAALITVWPDNTYKQPAMKVFRFDTCGGRLSRGREETHGIWADKTDDASADFEDHKGTGPVATFRVVNEMARLDSIHSGPGLTLTDVITEYARNFDIEAEDGPSDLVFYQDKIVAAVVRNFGDGHGSYRVLPLGKDWMHHIDDPMTDGEVEPHYSAEGLIPDNEDGDDDEAEEPEPEDEAEEDEPRGVHKVRTLGGEQAEPEAIEATAPSPVPTTADDPFQTARVWGGPAYQLRSWAVRDAADALVNAKSRASKAAEGIESAIPEDHVGDVPEDHPFWIARKAFQAAHDEAHKVIQQAERTLVKAVLKAHGVHDRGWWESMAVVTKSVSPRFVVVISPGVDDDEVVTYDVDRAEVLVCSDEELMVI
jgi:hypothetical protein